ncbi:uncharacterized protein B0J16DRAFT_396264 [Fusarium flagelliforme]|uniref:uncharacterized protein n=1 Tax=Fusarium flagelliforme TaxID=2675880 RepID=UPI001E8D8DA5|nr:uncharacterized protein B0J16DRAFT_396264 [Fusarium flagelliforme]KAH7188086.1 hypothetical protein B0J16DRAFT_396264 [Fusarium flagelliforme]
MASPSITIHRSVIQTTDKVRSGDLKYATFKISRDSEIVVDRTSTDSDWESFLADIPVSKPRFALYHFNSDNGLRRMDKVIFINWLPVTARVKARAIYFTFNCTLRYSFMFTGRPIEATDFDELTYKRIAKLVREQLRPARGGHLLM